MVKKQVIASLAFGVMCGFGGAEAMKSPYMVCPEAPGKDQYFSASKTMPCKIYEVDFQLKNVEGTPEKKDESSSDTTKWQISNCFYMGRIW